MIQRNDNLNNQVTTFDFSFRILFRSFAAPPAKPAPLSDEYLNETDDPAHRANVRQMDEYKDDNSRGSGNRHNRS